MAVTSRKRSQPQVPSAKPITSKGAKPSMPESSQNITRRAQERYSRSSWETHQNMHQRFYELLKQYGAATQKMQEETNNRLADAWWKRNEALIEATGKNEITQRCTDAAERFLDLLKRAYKELEVEKAAADLRFVTTLVEVQGQPDAQSRVQTAYQQYLSTLQDAGKKSIISETSESYAAYQACLKEAVDYASQHSFEAHQSFMNAVGSTWSDAAENARSALDACLKGLQQTVTEAQESVRKASLELVQELTTGVQEATSTVS